uniref:Uncharacterized protein n=1 Tax=Trichuris muris TaxID=70415 RepID=A0A5S6R4B4_TRIMR
MDKQREYRAPNRPQIALLRVQSGRQPLEETRVHRKGVGPPNRPRRSSQLTNQRRSLDSDISATNLGTCKDEERTVETAINRLVGPSWRVC